MREINTYLSELIDGELASHGWWSVWSKSIRFLLPPDSLWRATTLAALRTPLKLKGQQNVGDRCDVQLTINAKNARRPYRCSSPFPSLKALAFASNTGLYRRPE